MENGKGNRYSKPSRGERLTERLQEKEVRYELVDHRSLPWKGRLFYDVVTMVILYASPVISFITALCVSQRYVYRPLGSELDTQQEAAPEATADAESTHPSLSEAGGSKRERDAQSQNVHQTVQEKENAQSFFPLCLLLGLCSCVEIILLLVGTFTEQGLFLPFTVVYAIVHMVQLILCWWILLLFLETTSWQTQQSTGVAPLLFATCVVHLWALVAMIARYVSSSSDRVEEIVNKTQRDLMRPSTKTSRSSEVTKTETDRWDLSSSPSSPSSLSPQHKDLDEWIGGKEFRQSRHVFHMYLARQAQPPILKTAYRREFF
mmetsp:Transcript_28644/g.73132  ORF Transcript_28644/g.73132 Transcript_28644/m.73132 type:complete len:319 (-) Transcript_28644:271-1227(-)